MWYYTKLLLDFYQITHLKWLRIVVFRPKTKTWFRFFFFLKLGKSKQSSALQSARELLTILTILVNSKDCWVLIIIMQWISCNLKAGFPDYFFSIGINFTKPICPQRENVCKLFPVYFFSFVFFVSFLLMTYQEVGRSEKQSGLVENLYFVSKQL